jgi:hypothetical protein
MLTRPYIIQYNRIVVEPVGAVVNYNLYIRWSGNGNGDAAFIIGESGGSEESGE